MREGRKMIEGWCGNEGERRTVKKVRCRNECERRKVMKGRQKEVKE
jgi:hypothetical protein